MGETCPSGHALRQFTNFENEYFCNVCGNESQCDLSTPEMGSELFYGCRVCNWDVCSACRQTDMTQSLASPDNPTPGRISSVQSFNDSPEGSPTTGSEVDAVPRTSQRLLPAGDAEGSSHLQSGDVTHNRVANTPEGATDDWSKGDPIPVPEGALSSVAKPVGAVEEANFGNVVASEPSDPVPRRKSSIDDDDHLQAAVDNVVALPPSPPSRSLHFFLRDGTWHYKKGTEGSPEQIKHQEEINSFPSGQADISIYRDMGHPFLAHVLETDYYFKLKRYNRMTKNEDVVLEIAKTNSMMVKLEAGETYILKFRNLTGNANNNIEVKIVVAV